MKLARSTCYYRSRRQTTARKAVEKRIVQLRPEHINHVWSYDFMTAMPHDGRSLRLLTLLDEFSRECLAIRVARRLAGW